jgi:hypothetical protein
MFLLTTMTTHSGFGKPQSKPQSKRSTKRAEAAKQYDQMKADGVPEFEIYLRIRGKKNWYPIGVIAMKRSNQINQAIFGSQEDLLQGAFRLYPVLRKHQQQLEYGYRLKEYKDEPIQVAVPPQASQKAGLQTVVNQVKDRVAALLKRG